MTARKPICPKCGDPREARKNCKRCQQDVKFADIERLYTTLKKLHEEGRYE